MNYSALQKIRAEELSSSTLHGTVISLDARTLIRDVLSKGTLRAHNDMKDKFGQGTPADVRMEEIWREAFDNEYCFRKHGRIIITDKGRKL